MTWVYLTVNSMYFDAAYCAPDLFLIFSSVFCKGKTIFFKYRLCGCLNLEI